MNERMKEGERDNENERETTRLGPNLRPRLSFPPRSPGRREEELRPLDEVCRRKASTSFS